MATPMSEYMIRAVGLVNCSQGKVIAAPALLIRNGIIVAVDSVVDDQGLRTYAGDRMAFDYPGQFLVPGLIDFHIRLCLSGDGSEPAAYRNERADVLLRRATRTRDHVCGQKLLLSAMGVRTKS